MPNDSRLAGATKMSADENTSRISSRVRRPTSSTTSIELVACGCSVSSDARSGPSPMITTLRWVSGAICSRTSLDHLQQVQRTLPRRQAHDRHDGDRPLSARSDRGVRLATQCCRCRSVARSTSRASPDDPADRRGRHAAHRRQHDVPVAPAEDAIEQAERRRGVAPQAVGRDDGGDARQPGCCRRRSRPSGDTMPPWKWATSTRSSRSMLGDQAEGARGEGDVERQQRHVEAVHPDAVDLGRARRST